MRVNSVYIAVPCYGRLVDFGNCQAMAKTGHDKVILTWGDISLLAYNFNRLMSDAYNKMKERDITHFALVHADIGPESGWLGKMLSIMERDSLDVLSVVAPLKGAGGFTSCALDTRDLGRPRRLTTTEVSQMPKTFTGKDTKELLGSDKLMINTGCLVFDMSKLDPCKFAFNISDKIVEKRDGTYEAQNMPEDWDFSRKVYKKKLRYAATTEVALSHMGMWHWENQQVWGDKTDANV